MSLSFKEKYFVMAHCDLEQYPCFDTLQEARNVLDKELYKEEKSEKPHGKYIAQAIAGLDVYTETKVERF